MQEKQYLSKTCSIQFHVYHSDLLLRSISYASAVRINGSIEPNRSNIWENIKRTALFDPDVIGEKSGIERYWREIEIDMGK